MSSNGAAGAHAPRIELVTASGSPTEAAAVIAAVEQFLADTAPPAAQEEKPAMGGWQAAALREGIAARQVGGGVWGHSPSWREV